jgi:hypothetical protein
MVELYQPSRVINQTDICQHAAQGLINDYPVAVRSRREVTAGGFADATRNPHTWTVYFLVETEWAQVISARGLRREWTSLDRVEAWLRSLGFSFFWVRNDLDPAAGRDRPTSGPSLK